MGKEPRHNMKTGFNGPLVFIEDIGGGMEKSKTKWK